LSEEEEEEEYEFGPVLSIEFTLRSGETVSVRDSLDERADEMAVRRYAQVLIGQMGTDTVHSFAYWWGGDFYVDAVAMQEVAAISVSPAGPDDDEEADWDDWGGQGPQP
jgi:hypothetical protein